MMKVKKKFNYNKTLRTFYVSALTKTEVSSSAPGNYSQKSSKASTYSLLFIAESKGLVFLLLFC